MVAVFGVCVCVCVCVCGTGLNYEMGVEFDGDFSKTGHSFERMTKWPVYSGAMWRRRVPKIRSHFCIKTNHNVRFNLCREVEFVKLGESLFKNRMF